MFSIVLLVSAYACIQPAQPVSRSL